LFARFAAKSTVAVIGSAGYGKSALVASWLAQSGPGDAVAWLTLDRSDCDPGRLAADLLAALQSPASGRLGRSLLTFEAPPIFADRLAFVDALHEALFEADIPLTLVLDDLQEISRSQTAREMIDYLMLWMPAHVRTVIIARALPPLRLQRLRLAGRLELITHRDLAFTLPETAEAVRGWDPEIDQDAIEGIHQLDQRLAGRGQDGRPGDQGGVDRRPATGTRPRRRTRGLPRHRGADVVGAARAGIRA
jgi:LuxR family maltose regulon positive regulatory protein